jgi:quercetin dioxygenase-like cupin family protein
LATPGAGFLFNIILSRGSIPADVHQDIFIERDSVDGSTPNNNQGDNWSVKLMTSGPSDLAVQDVAFSTGGFTGWHYHPGLLLATVTEGSVEWYDVNCGLHVYNAGDSFIENNESHYVRNVVPVRARLMITYIMPKGAIRRLESDAPPCAAALGLQ